jgi:hypothetical protein
VIGLDFPVKPEWIHDVLRLWQPDRPISELVQLALAGTMQELGGEKTRRNSLTVILRYFVPTVGEARSRQTTSENVWASAARVYLIDALAPTWLTQIIAHNEVAGEIARYIAGRHKQGDDLTGSEVRRFTIARYGQRKVVTNSASAFLRTLQTFGVLEFEPRAASYRFATLLPVNRETFPLVVWAWWQAHPTPQVDLDAFAEDPAVALLNTGNFLDLWRTHQPGLWVLEERLDGRRAALKHNTPTEWKGALLSLVGTVM